LDALLDLEHGDRRVFLEHASAIAAEKVGAP
jgi:hypothetical protein